MRKHLITCSILAIVALLFAPAAMAQEGTGGGGGSKLQLTKGTMQLGGVTTFSIEMDMPEVGDNVTGFQLGVLPAIGYFVMDNLELFGEVGLSMFFGDLYEGAPKLIGFNVGAKYFLDVGGMNLYLGLGVGMGFFIPDGGDTQKTLLISAPIGILYAFNEHVALDLGLRFNYNMGMDDQGSSLNIPIGYLGVQAFF